MKLFIDSREFDFIYVDIGNIISLYQMNYKGKCNTDTLSQLENILDSDTISITTSSKSIEINGTALTYTHSYIYGMFLRTARGRCQSAVNINISEDSNKIYREQLTNITKNCASLLSAIEETPKISPKIRVKYVNLYSNVCKAFNNLTRLGGSFSTCTILNFKVLCDCYDIIMLLRGVLYPNSSK